MSPTQEELESRSVVIHRLLEAIRTSALIAFPRTGEISHFQGSCGKTIYTFEGEDDLLHLQIENSDGSEISPGKAQVIASFVLKGVPTSLIWMKTGRHTQHFYVGHDDLISSIELT